MTNFLQVARFSLLLALVFFAPVAVWSQEHGHEQEEMNDPGWETVLSAVSFFPTDKEIRHEAGGIVGTELHLTYWFSHSWALGGSYTIQFARNGEVGSELALIGSYKPARWITINAGPSVGLPDSHSETELSGYLESEFNVFLGQKLHLGPVVGGLVGKHSELFGGVHIGYEF